MIQLLPDVNLEGRLALLVAKMRAEKWREFWDYLDIRCLTFAEVGLNRKDSDAVVWQLCQKEKIILVTDNRNDDGPDSLESTMRPRNNSDCLPVFTLGDSKRVLRSWEYAEEVIESLFDQLMRIESLRGTGRLYLP